MLAVLMSVYVRESPQALGLAFQSLVEQTVMPAEVVLVKDGPLTSALEAVIGRYSALLPLRVVALPTNVGLAAALNQGLRSVNQPWVMRFDTDDVCDARRVELQQAWMREDRFDVFGAQIDEFDSDPSRPMRSRQVPCSHEDIVRFARRRNPFNHMTVCFRKSLVAKVGGYPDVALMEDYALWLKMIAAGARTANSPDVLVHARVGNGMVERRGGWRYARSEWRLQSLMYQLELKSVWQTLADGLIRSFVFLSPVWLRACIYQFALRQSRDAY